MTMTAQEARDAQAAAPPASAAVIAKCWSRIEEAVLLKEGPREVVLFETDPAIVSDIRQEFETTTKGFVVTEGTGTRVAIGWEAP